MLQGQTASSSDLGHVSTRGPTCTHTLMSLHSWRVPSCSVCSEANCFGHWSRTGTGNWRILQCGLPAPSQGIDSCPASSSHLAGDTPVSGMENDPAGMGAGRDFSLLQAPNGKYVRHYLFQEDVYLGRLFLNQWVMVKISGPVVGQGEDNTS